jgi:hypothetical protein
MSWWAALLFALLAGAAGGVASACTLAIVAGVFVRSRMPGKRS